MSLLLEDWVSRANALQRKGRAGRVRAGKCYGLYTRHRFEHRMRPYQVGQSLHMPHSIVPALKQLASYATSDSTIACCWSGEQRTQSVTAEK